MYVNLIAEMARKGLSNQDVAKSLDVDERTIRNYISGKTKIAWEDVQAIRNIFFPEYEISYLFAKTPRNEQ